MIWALDLYLLAIVLRKRDPTLEVTAVVFCCVADRKDWKLVQALIFHASKYPQMMSGVACTYLHPQNQRLTDANY